MDNYHKNSTGDWPSGKATGSGPVIGGSNPSSPAKHKHYRTLALSSFCFVIITNMTFKRLIWLPIKKTLVTLAILVAVFLILRIPHLFLVRTYNAECNGAVTCMNGKGREPINILLNDLIFVSRVCIELGLIFLVIQLVGKVVLRK